MANGISYGSDCTSRACPILTAGAGREVACIGERCSLWVSSWSNDTDWSTCVLNKQLDQTAGVYFQLKRQGR